MDKNSDATFKRRMDSGSGFHCHVHFSGISRERPPDVTEKGLSTMIAQGYHCSGPWDLAVALCVRIPRSMSHREA